MIIDYLKNSKDIKAIVFDFWGVLASMNLNGKVVYNKELIENIKELKKDYKIGLLSNSNKQSFEKYVKSQGFVDLFDVVVLSEQTGFAKPEKQIFEILLVRLKLQANQVLFFDDNKINVEAARNLGIQAEIWD